MRYATLGRSKLHVSALGLGTMTFGTGEGFAGLRPTVDDRASRRGTAASEASASAAVGRAPRPPPVLDAVVHRVRTEGR